MGNQKDAHMLESHIAMPFATAFASILLKRKGIFTLWCFLSPIGHSNTSTTIQYNYTKKKIKTHYTKSVEIVAEKDQFVKTDLNNWTESSSPW